MGDTRPFEPEMEFFYAAVDLWEDDLHDNGAVEYSIKVKSIGGAPGLK